MQASQGYVSSRSRHAIEQYGTTSLKRTLEEQAGNRIILSKLSVEPLLTSFITAATFCVWLALL
jgi:hypothetical protein